MTRKFFFSTLILVLTAFRGFSENSAPLPSEEAPTSIFSSKIGDSDVDLYLSGYWKINLTGGLGFSWDSTGSGIEATPFPGFSSTPVFSQEPDITLSLWLQNQYFFELSFIDDYALNTFLFGYNAAHENDFLQKVRIGNTDIGSGSYSLLNIPAAGADSLGAMAEFKGPNSQHEAVVRFDPAEKMEKSFKGSYEILKTRLPLQAWVKGSFFILPDKGVENLHVYIEDTSGPYTDSNLLHYRLATDDDAVISAEEGYVFFKEPQDTNIAVYYTKNGASVGDSSLGKGSLAADSDGLGNPTGTVDASATEDFYFDMPKYLGLDMSSAALSRTINGQTALLLYQPGQFSPFEMLSVYQLSFDVPVDGTPFDILLTGRNLSTGEKTSFAKGPVDKTVMFFHSSTDNALRSPANRYPFADKTGSGVDLYGHDMSTAGSPPDKELLLEQYEKVTAYNLGQNVLDGSVEMTVQGIADDRFTFDSKTGNVSLLFIPAADDSIDFYYRTKAAASRGGDFLAAVGNHFDISDNLSAEIGAGIRWNVSGGSYTEKQNESPGSILASAGLSYTGEAVQADINGGVSFYSPDTTGTFRLLGMDAPDTSVPATSSGLYPSSFFVSPVSGPHIVEENVNESAGDTTLEYDYPEVKKMFTVSGTPQNIAQFTWNTSGTWSAVAFTQPAALSTYRKLVFYMKTPGPVPDGDLDATSHPLSAAFTNPDGKGLVFYFSPSPSTHWKKYVFNYRDKTLTIDGTAQSVTVTRDNMAAENINKFTLRAECSSAGSLYLDEVHLEDAVFGVTGGISTRFTYTHPGVLLSAGKTPVVGNVHFSNTSRLAGNNFGAGFTVPESSDRYTSSEISFSLFSAQLSGDLDIQTEGTSLYVFPGWKVMVPLFKQQGAFVDSYREQKGSQTRAVHRANTLTVPLGNSLFSLGAQSAYADTSLHQQWDTAWNTTGAASRFDTSLTLGTTAATAPYAGENFSQRVLTSYVLLFPFTAAFPQRTINFTAGVRSQFTNTSVHLTEQYTAATTGTTERKTSGTQGLTLEVPVTFNSGTPQEWKITPSYSRTLTVKQSPRSDKSFYTDAQTALAGTASQANYFTSLPLYELFTGSTPSFAETSTGFDSVMYKPELSLSFLRQSGNSPADIVLPSTAELSVSRIQNREWDAVTDTKAFSFSVGNSVYNLYGELGSHPRFNWYQTEEYTAKTGLVTEFPLQKAPSVTLKTQQYLHFIISKERSLNFESDLSFAWFSFSSSGTLLSSYNWAVPLSGSVKIPVIDPEGGEKTSFLHKESLTVQYSHTDEPRETDITCTLRHSTDFLIGDKGKISASAGIGFSRKEITQNTNSFSYLQAAFEGGIGAQLNF